MSELKIKSGSYLGFIHALIGGLIFPLVVELVIYAIIQAIFQKTSIVTNYVEPTAGLVILGLGAWYSARRLQRKYVINNPKKVATIATAYNVIIVIIVSLALDFIFSGKPQTPHLDTTNLIFTVLGYVVFYVVSQISLSKKQVLPAI
jgi:hypothetical protein